MTTQHVVESTTTVEPPKPPKPVKQHVTTQRIVESTTTVEPPKPRNGQPRDDAADRGEHDDCGSPKPPKPVK